MKKVIIIVLMVILLTMSTVYAVWTDSVSSTVTAQSAVIRLDYTSRKLISNKTYKGVMNYTTQGTGAPSNSNPYLYIEETIPDTDMLYLGTQTRVKYTLKNNGDTDLKLTGITLNNIDYTSTGIAFLDNDIADTLRIQYSIKKGGQTYTANITDIRNQSSASFASSNIIIGENNSCTLTVTYWREATTSWWIIDSLGLYLQKTDEPQYIVER